jgi:predicted RND superfamily exporter protein
VDLPALLAHWITNHRRALLVLAAALTVVSALVLVRHARFASDVLDLLPHGFDSVQTFKQFDREFSQARELTFAVVDDTGEVDLDSFVDHFGSKLRAESWVARVMERSPMESEEGMRDIPQIAVPLLLNLEPSAFTDAIRAIEPAAINARFTRLRAAIESGSPKAEVDLQFDPLGIVAPALKPLSGSLSIEQTRPLASRDGTLRIVLALTRQEDLGPHACQQTMRRAERIRQQVLDSWEGVKPQVLVTGRTAYVSELSLVMRTDVRSTVIGSTLFVGAMFWLGFRRIRPLLAMMLTLALGCLVAVAFGAFVFRELNMITIGLCAILVGLGEDFGVMFYGIYRVERDRGQGHEQAIATALRHHGRGVVFGALTTGAAFLCLAFSECSGFVQLGVLITFGIVATGGLMMTVFFVLLTSHHRIRRSVAVDAASARMVRSVWSRPRAWTITGAVILVISAVAGFGPWGTLRFETNPRSLEPSHSDAGDALRLIQRKMPVTGEPVLALIQSPDAESFHRAWQQAQSRWAKLVETGRLKSVNSPAGLAISSARQAANARKLAGIDIAAVRASIEAAAARENFSTAAITPALALVDRLSDAAGNAEPIDWRKALPADSPWWFVIDRFFGRTSNLGAAYLVPAQPVTSFAENQRLREEILVPEIDMHLAGWRYMLAELIPWAQGKLTLLSAGMILLNLLLLGWLFRRGVSVAIVFAGLALAIGGLLATLKFTGVSLNLFNVLAFPLVLGVGVDYAIYFVLAMREADPQRELTTIFRPILLSGVTTVAGFGSLVTAQNPGLRGFGLVCAFGIGWCLVATFFFVLPLAVWRDRR